MIYKISAKVILLFMSVAMLFNNISLPMINLGNNEITIEYEFENEKPYSAAGTVSVASGRDRTYDLYWGDENGKILKTEQGGTTATYGEFVSVDVENGEGSADVYSFTAIPDGAKTVVARVGKFEAGTYTLPEEKQPEKEEPLYRFGALSDVHFNRYRLSLTDDAMIAFPNALDFLNSFGVSLVGLSGDLSNKSELDSFKKFNSVISEYDFPVYTSTGNHDVNDNFVQNDWNKYVNPGVFGDTRDKGIVEAASNGLDFVYAPDGEDGDIFIFYSQYQWSYKSADSRILTDGQLDWLEKQLDKYSDNTVFLFFHTFLANDSDEDPYSGVGNLINDKGVYYNLMFTRNTPDEIRFRHMLKENKNVIFFSGHSHWSYAMQKFNERLNISDFDGEYCTMVHISSVSSPRTVSNTDTKAKERFLRQSEGYLVSVYPDRIVLTAVDFYMHEILSYANYVIER